MPNYPQYFNPYVQQMQQAPVMPIQNTSSMDHPLTSDRR